MTKERYDEIVSNFKAYRLMLDEADIIDLLKVAEESLNPPMIFDGEKAYTLEEYTLHLQETIVKHCEETVDISNRLKAIVDSMEKGRS